MQKELDYEDLIQFDTKLTADVCEWQPTENYNSSDSILACATYYLNKEINQREGCLYIMNFNSITNKFNEINAINFESSGILDMKWLDHKHIITLDSKEAIELFNFESLKSVYKLELNGKENDDSIGLAFDFITNTSKTNISKLVSSNSKGKLNILNCEDGQNMSIDSQFDAHEFEIWSVHIDRKDVNIIHSGADDNYLKIWDLRDNLKHPKQQCSLFNGGVTQILGPYSANGLIMKDFNENNLLCSSYDEQIYVLDKRNFKKYVKNSKKLNGGVWKMHVNEDNLILCACMHTGVHVVELESLESKLYYDKHGLNNLAYGCDWLKTEKSEYLTATCSFYNHELRIWKIKNKFF